MKIILPELTQKKKLIKKYIYFNYMNKLIITNEFKKIKGLIKKSIELTKK